MNTKLVFKDRVVYHYDSDWLYKSDTQYEDHLCDNRYLRYQELAFQPGDVVYDIGAFIGTVSIRLALLGGIVHAFEGSPINIARLRQIFTPFRQITLHPFAVGNKSGTEKCRFNDCVAHAQQMVQFVRFDDLDLPLPAFVKIDIEGWETVALHHMTKLLAARPFWQLEWHKGLNIAGVSSFLEPTQGGFDPVEFERQGYRILDSGYNLINADAMGFGQYFVVPQ